MKKIIKVFNLLLLISAIMISNFIFFTKEFQFETLNKIFEVVGNYLNIAHQQSVSSTLYYSKIGKYQYTNDAHCIVPPLKATIIQVKEDSLILKCDNGYYATFFNIFNLQVSLMDVVTSSDVLAYFDEYFMFYFMSGDQIYSYEEIMASH